MKDNLSFAESCLQQLTDTLLMNELDFDTES